MGDFVGGDLGVGGRVFFLHFYIFEPLVIIAFWGVRRRGGSSMFVIVLAFIFSVVLYVYCNFLTSVVIFQRC